MRYGADINKKFQPYAFIINGIPAPKEMWELVVKYLVENGADVNVEDENAFHHYFMPVNGGHECENILKYFSGTWGLLAIKPFPTNIHRLLRPYTIKMKRWQGI